MTIGGGGDASSAATAEPPVGSPSPAGSGGAFRSRKKLDSHVSFFDRVDVGTAAHQQSANVHANGEGARYLTSARTHPDAKGLDLRSFLIMPVQRVPRYRLLLKELLKRTPEGHADRASIQEALGKVEEVQVARASGGSTPARTRARCWKLGMHSFIDIARKQRLGLRFRLWHIHLITPE